MENLCSAQVKAWTAIVKRVLSITDSTINSPVNLVWPNNEIIEIPSTLILFDLRSTVKLMVRKVLSYPAEDIGTRSLRSGCAMALRLAELPEYVIKLIGHWKSGAFLVYIRPQIKYFSCGVTCKMIQVQPFYTIPALAKTVFPLLDLKQSNWRRFSSWCWSASLYSEGGN